MVKEAQAQVVHVRRARAIGLDPRRIFNQPRDQHECQEADGNVDEEDPAPRIVVGDPAAQRGADGRREHGDQAVERERLSALVRLEGIGHDGLRHGLQSSAACSLEHAEDKQHRQREARRRRGKLAIVKMAMQTEKKFARPMTLEAQPPSGSTMAFDTR